MTTDCFVLLVSLQLLLEVKVGGEHIIDKVVKVGAINQPFSLVARVHGGPAELVIRQFPLHEAPHWSAHHRHGLLVGHNQDLADLIKFNSLAEELACKGKSAGMTMFSTYMYV